MNSVFPPHAAVSAAIHSGFFDFVVAVVSVFNLLVLTSLSTADDELLIHKSQR